MQTLLYEVDGRRLFLESAGEGSPTVVFEASAGLSTRSMHVTADQSGHYVHRDQPGLVVDAIARVVQMARASL